MKLKRKLLIALLSVACMTTSAVALSACNNEEADTRDPAIVAVYNQYVSATADPLSYDEWLASIKGAQGPAGQKGDEGKSAYELYLESLTGSDVELTEEEWLASLKGDSGKGVSKVELNADGTKLVIIYTDNTKEEVDLPDGFHKHTYGETVTIIEPTSETEGLGVKVCSADGHTEVVVLSKLVYTLKLTYADGTPAANLAVSLYNGNTRVDGGTTTADGELVLSHFGKKGNYTVRLADSKLATLGTVTTGDADTYEITVAKSAANGISESGYYAVSVSWASDWMGDYAQNRSLRLRAGEKDTHFKLSVDEDFGGWRYDEDNWTVFAESVYEVNVYSGSSKEISYSFDETIYDSETYPTVSYLIKAELTDAPARGTDFDIPLTLSIGENNTTIETENKVAYYVFNGTQLEDTAYATLTFGAGVTVQLYATTNWQGNLAAASLNQITAGTATLVDCTSGEPTVSLNQWNNSYFKVTTTDPDGKADIKVENYYAPGDIHNPFESAAVGTKTVISASGMSVYATFTPEETKTYTIELAVGAEISVTDGNDNSYGSVPAGSKLPVAMTKGTTYYFQVWLESNQAEYTIKEYNAATDSGFDANFPRVLELSDNKAQLEVTDSILTMYYQINNLPEALGRLNITVLNSAGKEMIYTELRTNYETWENEEVEVNAAAITYLEDADAYSNRDGVSLYEGGGSALIKVYLNFPYNGGAASVGYDGKYTIKAEFVPIVAVDHKFTVKSGETLIGGVTVGLYEVGAAEDAKAVATGTTGANGVATVNVVPGVYEVRLSGLNTDTYKYATKVYTDLPDDGSKDKGADYNVEVLSKVAYKYTAKYANGNPVAGLVVTFTLGAGEDATTVTATTGADGVATFAPVFPDAYAVTFSGYNNEEYKVSVGAFNSSTLEYDVTLLAMVNYTVTVNDASGAPLSGITVTIKDSDGNTATGTTGADGTVTLEDKLVEGVYSITCSGANIPEGYVIKGETLSGSDSVTLTASEIEYQTIDENTMSIMLTAEETYYKVAASGAGSYTLTTNNNGAVIYLNGTRLTLAWYGVDVTLKEGDVLMVYSTQLTGYELGDALDFEFQE